ncbi:hypothetical protein QTP86_018263 [Hemibagrus guttatus]|nr:hypothetical protein QTP86_018263 [Hemibagrus guttatus]
MHLGLSGISSAERQRERQRRLTQDRRYCGSLGHFVAECPLRPACPMRPNPRPSHLHVHATSVESPLETRSITIPACYSRFRDVFCPKKASKLPPHRPWDCAIDLIPGEPVPRGRIYSLSLPEEKAMEEYIMEALAQGYIRPSTSPAASSFFFVAVTCHGTYFGVFGRFCFYSVTDWGNVMRLAACPVPAIEGRSQVAWTPPRKSGRKNSVSGYSASRFIPGWSLSPTICPVIHPLLAPSQPLGHLGVVTVAKKDGSLRPCIDYRALNKITVKFRYPLPLVPAALERWSGATVFTKLDLRSSYNLIRIREGDEWKTAFVTPTAHYEYLAMPYGLVNAPAVFQDFMHKVLRDFLHKFVLVYIDDILIYSRSMANHQRHVAEVLHWLRAYHLFLKAEKCLFHQSSVQFLGYVIDRSGVRMDEKKVAAIRDWPTPTSVKELQRFLGFANFYRRFIKGYSSITSPLTNLHRNKPKALTWTSAATQAFHTLKQAFTTAPLLVHPNPELPFVVVVDASTTGVRAVLFILPPRIKERQSRRPVPSPQLRYPQ